MSIRLQDVTYIYMSKTPYEKAAIKKINLEIKQGEFVGIIGHTGSGKSTLVQHLNGLLKPSSGMVHIDGQNIHEKGETARNAKRSVGMVFQYPEHQLFEESVYEDIAFGPRNLGVKEEEIETRVKKALDFVGLDFEKFAKRTPFQLSGGQMRRVAIAGVVALDPKYLVLDEPSAGLDPRGRDEIFGQIMNLHQATGITVVLVSHNMEDVARMANRLIVMNKGEILLDGKPKDIFCNHQAQLKEAGVDVPPLTLLMNQFKQRGLEIDSAVIDIATAAQNVYKAVRRG
ncbi:energy-coupling factor transporter ATPase [Pelosinus baikalensis]|uniref:Energy-coupling factor transporter ATP-binding protein EcfA2 n=1 Tax=Pelosinus baikalensis TaxID=2892015 RepID=A0ABS8HX45_9FIRM|nr:energy-coupling factor transporter ATPase [Pelosinus baikalensis]MCC5467084.1 energy-coupling factor transporter ATPase [Pelosinus baikalensis]